jgi:hypothetical protein
MHTSDPNLNTPTRRAGWRRRADDGAAAAAATAADDHEQVLDMERLSQLPDDAFHTLFKPPPGGGPPAVPSALVPALTVPGVGQFLHGAPVDKPPGVVRFVCISDTHGQHRSIRHLPPGDVLLHAGDITNVGELQQLQDFSAWLSEQPHKHKVVIAGNHDVTLDRAHYSQEANRRRWHRNRQYDIDECRAALTNCTWLEDEATTVEGYTIYGSPWQPEFFDWAYVHVAIGGCARVVPTCHSFREAVQKVKPARTAGSGREVSPDLVSCHRVTRSARAGTTSIVGRRAGRRGPRSRPRAWTCS